MGWTILAGLVFAGLLRGYREVDPHIKTWLEFREVRITGAVVRMRRSGPRGDGSVRLRVIAGAEVPHVRITLAEEDYRIAGHAHLVGLPVRLHGRLESRGGFRRLTGASGVAPVQVEEAERDRLMKSLQENRDFFEEACSGEDDD